MNIRKHLIKIGLLLAVIVVIALRETGALTQFGWAAVALVTPGLVHAVYRLWDRRAHLKDNMDMATDSFRALKTLRRMKKEDKENGRSK